MDTLLILKLAFRNSIYNWRHSLATICAMVAGFCSITLFQGYIEEINFQIHDGFGTRGMLGDFVVEKKDADQHLEEDPWGYSLDAKEQGFIENYLKASPDFAHRVRFLNVSGYITNSTQSALFIGLSYDIEEGKILRGERWNWDALAGKPLYLNGPGTFLLAKGLGKFLGCTIEDRPFLKFKGGFIAEERPYHCEDQDLTLSASTETSQVNAITLKVSGIIDSGFRELDKRFLHLRIEDAQRLFDTDKITLVSVKLKDGVNTEYFIQKFQEEATKSGFSFTAQPWLEHRVAQISKSGLNILMIFKKLFLFVVLMIGIMSIANTMMKSINERIQEIGTLRSLGFFSRDLIWIFAWEGAFICIFSCFAGGIFTVLLSYGIDALGISYKAGILSLPVGLRIRLLPLDYLYTGLFLSFFALSTSWFCARKACRMNVADAIRYV